MTEPTDYYGIRIAPGENLAARFPQAAVRARMYRLEDDGASDLARRKRSLRESIAARRAIILQIEQRQAGAGKLPPRPQGEAERFIAGHREGIRELKAKLAALAPATPVIAPMTRRVAREDRRRARKTKSTER
jgi:small-conductance mechanosensitive channel